MPAPAGDHGCAADTVEHSLAGVVGLWEQRREHAQVYLQDLLKEGAEDEERKSPTQVPVSSLSSWNDAEDTPLTRSAIP